MHERLRQEDARFHIDGLTCASDGVRGERAMRRIRGILSIVVNPVTDTAYVAYDPTRTDRSSIQHRLEATGYGPVQPA